MQKRGGGAGRVRKRRLKWGPSANRQRLLKHNRQLSWPAMNIGVVWRGTGKSLSLSHVYNGPKHAMPITRIAKERMDEGIRGMRWNTSSEIEVAPQKKSHRSWKKKRKENSFFAPNPNGNGSRSITWKSSSCESRNFKTGMKPALQRNKAPFGAGMSMKRLRGEVMVVVVVGGGYGTVSVRLSSLQWGKMQAIYLDRFPFKAGAPRGCKNRVRGTQGGVEGWKGRGATPASFQTAQQKVSASAWLKPPHCQVKSVEELILGSVGFVKHWLWTGICSLSAFFFFKYKLLSRKENVFFSPFSLKPSKET